MEKEFDFKNIGKQMPYSYTGWISLTGCRNRYRHVRKWKNIKNNFG